MLVNDRSVSVLENYDFEVIRTQKSGTTSVYKRRRAVLLRSGAEQMHCKKLAAGKRMQFKGWTGMPGCYAHPGGSAQRAAFSTAAAGVWAARSQPGRGI